MTDTTESIASAPTKKRTLFKKAAWQTAAKTEGKDKDIFSHSDRFADIVADDAKRKKEERQRAQAARKRKPAEEGDGESRKVSRDRDEPGLHSSGSRDSSRAKRTEISGSRSRTPLSPVPAKSDTDSLSARYASLQKSSSGIDSLPRKIADLIDLGGTDSEDEDLLYKRPPPRQPPAISLPRLPSKPAPSEQDEDVEEMDDPVIAELKARARARAAKESEAVASTSTGPAAKSAVVELFISSEIPDTVNMLIKIKIDTKIEKPWNAWCSRQGYSKEKADTMFLTWKERHIYNSTTIARLGVSIDSNGFIVVEDDPQIYDETNLPKIHLEAWTTKLFEEFKKTKAEEEAAKRRPVEAPREIEEKPSLEPVPEVRKIRLYLKAKGKPDFKICVNQDTTIGHLTAAFKEKMAIPKDCPITLMFDGDRLKPMDTVADVDIEDKDSIEVHYK